MKRLLSLSLCALLVSSHAFAASYAPLVLKSGQPQQAQSGDTIKLPNVATGTQCLHADSAGAVTGSGADCGTVATSQNNTFTKAQRGTPVSLSISTATFTPDFDAAQNFEITLVHASCPCTLANPSTTLVPGQSGYIKVVQSASGSDTITTWGSSYYFPGGTSTVTFSSGASQYDMFSYVVDLASHINLTPPAQNFSH